MGGILNLGFDYLDYIKLIFKNKLYYVDVIFKFFCFWIFFVRRYYGIYLEEIIVIVSYNLKYRNVY